MTTNDTNATPASNPRANAPLLSRLTFPQLWFTAVAAWLVFGLLLLVRSSNYEITYVLFFASAIPVGALTRRRWFKRWLFVAEVRLLAGERWLSLISMMLAAAILIPTVFYNISDAMGIHFNGLILLLLINFLYPISIGVLGFNLLLQFITDVWNLRWTVVAILVHIPLWVTIFM